MNNPLEIVVTNLDDSAGEGQQPPSGLQQVLASSAYLMPAGQSAAGETASPTKAAAPISEADIRALFHAA